MVSVMVRRNVELCDNLHCNAIAEEGVASENLGRYIEDRTATLA
jgi:hypothetical protein